MLIYQQNNVNYIFIHIPKNGGCYIRKKICSNNDNKIIKKCWGYCFIFEINQYLDLAHIPYIKRDIFIEKNIYYNYFTYSRNPYDRIISTYFYYGGINNKYDFKQFVKTKLICYDFSLDFNINYVHFYPQYLFICDENLNIPITITIHKLENVENPIKYNLLDFFDDECISIINKIYLKDFVLFNYPMITNDVEY